MITAVKGFNCTCLADTLGNTLVKAVGTEKRKRGLVGEENQDTRTRQGMWGQKEQCVYRQKKDKLLVVKAVRKQV